MADERKWVMWAGYGHIGETARWPIAPEGTIPANRYPRESECVAEAFSPEAQARIVTCVNALADVDHPEHIGELLDLIYRLRGILPVGLEDQFKAIGYHPKQEGK